MKLRIFAGAYHAYSPYRGAGISSFSTTAFSEDEAIGIGIRLGKEKFPVPEWSQHSATVVEISQEQIEKIANWEASQ